MDILNVTVRFFVALTALLVVVASSQAGIVVPDGFNPDDKYHLVFVTDGSRDALSSDIADYNLFVNGQAAMNSALTGTDMGVEWFAIASTETTQARDNAVVGAGVPVYMLDGTTKVADGFGDKWDGTLDAQINLNQFPATISTSVWTGSTVSGGSPPVGTGGPLGTSFPALGDAGNASDGWITSSSLTSTGEFRLYALSEQLVVVPEPSTCGLLLIGCGVVVWAFQRGRAVRK